MGQLLEWKVSRELAATNRQKVENDKTSNRKIDIKTQVFCQFPSSTRPQGPYSFSWIPATCARNAVGPLGDNLIRELTGQSDPECKLSVMVSTHFLRFPVAFCSDSRLLLVASCRQWGMPWAVMGLESISRLHVCSVSTLSRLVAPSCRSAFHSCTLHP